MSIRAFRIAFLLLVVAPLSSALATPAVGDRVERLITHIQNGITEQHRRTYEITAWDPYSDQYLVKETILIPGETPRVYEDWKPARDFLTDKGFEYRLKHCEQFKQGVQEKIQILAGTFVSCRNQDEYSSRWIGRVPFEILKTDTTFSGLREIVEVESFQWGVKRSR